MWTEINPTDSKQLTKLHTVQKNMNSYYDSELTPVKSERLFNRKASRNLRGFIYDDGKDIVVMMTLKDPKGKGLNILTAGTDKVADDMSRIAAIVHTKIQSLMDEYKETVAFGTWTIGKNHAVGDAFFAAVCDACAADNGKACGYSKCTKEETTMVKSLRGLLTMYR